ncbi:DUF4245 domain-containing protein [Streptomyces sp. NPDC089919]|uniref:DUF4245 domain-containing protein n=1 Tax=Streptomyces sp. NPDC089919 TaxID=3155188 RepID=UPI00343CE3C4
MAGKSGKQTIWDMVRSLAVIGIVVAAIYVFIPHDDSADPVRTVDYRVELITARRAAPYPVAAPVGLADEWRATSVSYERKSGNAWHLGFLDPEGQYVAVEQSTELPRTYLPRVTQQAQKTEKTQQAGGQSWQVWEGEHYNALVREDRGATTVVTGTAPVQQLAKVAGMLEAKKG